MKSRIACITLACTIFAGLNMQADAANSEIGVPGPRNCFFSRGPVSGDPYANALYPDSTSAYWVAFFNTPEGARLELKGEFPRSRYISFSSFNEQGVPLDSLADYQIHPEADNINPFIAGAVRDSQQRDYRLSVLNAAQAGAEEAISPTTEKPGALHAPTSKNDQQIVVYRIQAADEGLHPAGGVALPEPLLTLKDGSVLQGVAACEALQAAQFPRLAPGTAGMPKDQYLALLDQPDKADTHQAKQTPEWHILLERDNQLGTGDGFTHPDNPYIRTLINTRFGDVLVIRGKAPTTPETRNGDKSMGAGQLRYWSMCSYQSLANTRVNACVHDEQVPLDADGYYTVMLSKAKDRPRTAHPECGVAWLPIADDGDGVKDAGAGMLQLSNLLAAADFQQAISRIEKDADIDKVMGDYAPKGVYLQSNIIETLWTCTDPS